MSKRIDSPPTAERFLHWLARSGLIDRDELRHALDSVPEAMRRDAKKLADHLVVVQVLTHFQAAKLLQGTWQGLVLGPYSILAPLGRGGMGSVYLARDSDAGNRTSKTPALIALKILPPKRAKEEERTLARFRREMDLCRRVSHVHLTRTFDAGVIQGVYFIAMEYIRGQGLRQLIKGGGPLPAARAARLFAEIAEGLEHAHEKGLIHRDLKPSNLMVTPNGHAKILDLGLALAVDEDLPTDITIVGGQGYVVGTMDYIAPEQVDEPSQVDARADLYSLGCALNFALTGQPPFPGGTSREKMQRHRAEYAEPVSDLNPTVPSAFSRIVERLMEKKPARRYESAGALRAALLPWVAGDPERPLDVDPMLSESEAVKEIEAGQEADPGLWWEEVPVISFEATARYSSSRELTPVAELSSAEDETPAAESEASEGANPLIVIGVIVGVVALILLLEMIRR
jgi:serine/threonine protein kinase